MWGGCIHDFYTIFVSQCIYIYSSDVDDVSAGPQHYIYKNISKECVPINDIIIIIITLHAVYIIIL